MDLAKYHRIFLEEAADHLAEMSGALLALEKNPSDADAIEVVFRMAHSIKGMAASLGYDSITELSHRLEDRMEGVRSAGTANGADDLGVLFRALVGLEGMVAAVGESGESPAPDPELLEALAAAPSDPPRLKKKLLNPT